jgi:hypothetical protein
MEAPSHRVLPPGPVEISITAYTYSSLSLSCVFVFLHPMPTDPIHSELHFSTDGAVPQRIRFWKSGQFFGFW